QGEPIKLLFNVSGISEVNNDLYASLPTNIESNNPNSNIHNLNSEKVSLQTISSTKNIETPFKKTLEQTQSNVKSKFAALTPMTSGYKYRILLYDNNTGAYQTTVLATVGTQVVIPAVK